MSRSRYLGQFGHKNQIYPVAKRSQILSKRRQIYHKQYSENHTRVWGPGGYSSNHTGGPSLTSACLANSVAGHCHKICIEIKRHRKRLPLLFS